MIKNVILKKLKVLEKDNNIKILFAVESGSREWGFASVDSDYDVRCVHVSSANSYLGLEEPKEQIDLIDGDIDIVSWDVKKFFRLFLKSNPTVSEWLSSNISYVERNVSNLSRKDLRKIFNKSFSRSRLIHHYLSLAEQNYQKYIGNYNKPVLLKKYVYILRAIGCVEYIKNTNNLPPLNWRDSSIYLPEEVKAEFSKLVELKKNSEKTKDVRIRLVDDYISEKLNKKVNDSSESFDKEKINKLVIGAIKNQ